MAQITPRFAATERWLWAHLGSLVLGFVRLLDDIDSYNARRAQAAGARHAGRAFGRPDDSRRERDTRYPARSRTNV